jgi:hypothetical protein
MKSVVESADADASSFSENEIMGFLLSMAGTPDVPNEIMGMYGGNAECALSVPIFAFK